MIRITSPACKIQFVEPHCKSQCVKCGAVLEYKMESSPYNCYTCGVELPDLSALIFRKDIRVKYHLEGEEAITVAKIDYSEYL